MTRIASAALALALLPSLAPAAPLDIPITTRTLPNRLRVVVAPNHLVPTVAVSVHYDVGSAVETPGRTGFAHLFEHMMFEGTANVGKMEHFAIVAEAGGICNGSTGPDHTEYWESVPRNAFELALWLEADRMTTLDLSPANFENQRDAVIQERQENYDNQAYVPSFLRINELAYPGYFAYSHSVIGDRADLEAMPFQDTVTFFHTHYVPANAVLVVAGDVDPDAAFAAVETYFGKIPAGDPPPFVFPDYAPPAGERVESLVDPLAPLPAFHIAWNVPPFRSPDSYALDLLGTWLTDGETAPMYRDLVKDRALVAQLSVGLDERRGPDLFSVFAVCAPGHEPAEARAAVDEWIDRIAAEGIPDDGLQRAKNLRRKGFLEEIRTNLRLANQLARYQLYYGDAALLLGELDRWDAVTTEDVRRAVGTWLRRDNRAVLDVLPPPPPPPETESPLP
ncbi:MAG: insulinase family protein [Deltaproteobacteria bacterium]|nr:insulinase family protein [Deltaproteobacteria bacterium]